MQPGKRGGDRPRRVPGALDPSLFRSLPDVHVLNGPGGYGDFSHLDRYFAAVDWLDAQGIAFDWLQNMTGQDYPLRPIAEIERVLADSGVDGHLQYAPVHPERTPPDADWGAGPEFRLCKPFDTHMRFDYGTGGSDGRRGPSSDGCGRS